MGISAQSLYAAFGSKAGLYREALDWYVTTFGASAGAWEQPDPITTFQALLLAEALRFSNPDRPRGCMVSTGVLGCAEENEDVARSVSVLREANVARIAARLERARTEGELRRDADAVTIARFIGATIQGLSIQAHDGADREALIAVARLAGEALDRHRAAPPA